ncbi:hypothetical protein SG34_015740 [Thalassomonas viridans]|uniref:Uncharacterized protein n=1 Tax=Thalassomonas viridans TaxID=137584 RepID=A0AAF0C783_9GAMM|nr:hypothetical protein [Thalassomonas viridans]WDE02895.1 hypothetical protein SG34_015740 [Thalassomonas viridans]
MNNPISKLDEIDKLLKSWQQSTYPSFQVYEIIKELINELKQDDFAQDSYVTEKLSTLSWHIDSIVGEGNGNGHDGEKHYKWAKGDLNKLKVMAGHPDFQELMDYCQ